MNYNVYLGIECLPKYESGKYKNKINWKESIGYKVPFIYKDVIGEIEIINYERPILTIKYNNKISSMGTSDFLKVKFAKLLGKRTCEFKVNINDQIKDDKRDLTIIDREYRRSKNGNNKKWYKYKCNKCGWDEGWIEESKLLYGNGCACCDGKVVVKGINDMATTTPWLVKYLVNPDDAHKYTQSSGEKIKIRCPDCGYEKEIKIYSLYKYGFSCNKCSDGLSYPNKLMFNILDQFHIDFINEYNPNWANGRKYDFYIPSKQLIIEMDGGLGHGHKIHSKSSLTKEQSKAIDKWKDEQANKHNLKIVRIDCNYEHKDREEFIKTKILNSELSNYFNLNNINWLMANEYALSNLIKISCEYYNEHKNKMYMKDIAKNLNIHFTTLLKYLKIGSKLNWCEYKPKH